MAGTDCVDFDLRKTLSSWPESANENIAALGYGWSLPEKAAQLHVAALRSLERVADDTPDDAAKASMLLGLHGLALFLETMSLASRGVFDVATHLLRASFDCQSLACGVARDAQLAKDLLDGRQGLAGQSRIDMVETLRTVNPELADLLDERLRKQADAGNHLAHVGPSHLAKIVEGRVDGNVVRQIARAALENEQIHLTWLSANNLGVLDKEWHEGLTELRREYLGWKS